MVSDKDLQYSARENGLEAAIKAVKAEYLKGHRDGLVYTAIVAYQAEYDASMEAYRIAYKIHDDAYKAKEAT